MASGNLFIEARRLYNVPNKYKATAMSMAFEMSVYEGRTALIMPKIVEVGGREQLCVEWPNTWEFNLDDPDDFQNNIIDFEVKDADGRVLGRACISTNNVDRTKPYEEDVLIKPHGAPDFVGAKLKVAITYQMPPTFWPQHLQIRVEDGHSFHIGPNQIADENSQIYIAVTHGENKIGSTRALPGPSPKWMDYLAEDEYKHEPWVNVTGYAIHNGETVLIGSTCLNIWNILDGADQKAGQWIKRGEIHLLNQNKDVEAPRGVLRVTVRFSNDLDPSQLALSDPMAPGLIAPPPTTVSSNPYSALNATPANHSPIAAGTVPTSTLSDEDCLTPAEATDKLKEARRLATKAEDAARAADNAAADADMAAHANPSREVDELANDADLAAKKARKAADKALDNVKDMEDAIKRPKIRADVMYKLMDNVKSKTNDALDECEQAEQDAIRALRLNADDLAAKAKDYYTKTADYATQTEKLAGEFDEIPKIKSLSYGAKEDQAGAMLAAQDARSEAKTCREAKTVADAYAAMKECEAMVKDAKKCEQDAQDKWKKANKLAQKARKDLDDQQQREWQQRQNEAAAEALKKQKERQASHKQDKAERQKPLHDDGENDAYHLAMINMNSPKVPPHYNRGGIFKNCCWEPARTNPNVRSVDTRGNSAPSLADSNGNRKITNVNLSEFVIQQNPENVESGRHAATAMGRNDLNDHNFNSLSLAETSADGRQRKPQSYTEEYQANRYELVETMYPYHTRKTPWCWCFGCQCCHCCGEC